VVKTIDLRSDTVTRPTPAMRAAMAGAEVGDDVYGEDPTVNRLQELAAKMLGKEAAIYVPSGTMANQLALRALTQPGDVVLASDGAHVLRYESGAAAALSGVQIQTIGNNGSFTVEEVLRALPAENPHIAPVSLLAFENTHNAAGGRIFPFDGLSEVAIAAKERGLRLHLDGARLFNAVVATGVPAVQWTQPFDTVSFCLSKGLGAPVGSLVCASADLIHRLHRLRKLFGGGMRQSGILAAAGIYALEHHIDRLVDDHRNARRLAAGLETLGIDVSSKAETNMVMFRVREPARFHRAIHRRQLLINPIDAQRFRAVLHLDVVDEDVDDALQRIGEALAES
jgi:threonine aldolase